MSQGAHAHAAEPTVAAHNAALWARLPVDDTRDLDDARRGFIVEGERGLLLVDPLLSAEPAAAAPGLLGALTLDQLFDALGIRLDGPRSGEAAITVRWCLSDGELHTMRLRNGVLTHLTGSGPAADKPDVEVGLAEADLRAVLLGAATAEELAGRGREPAQERTSE
ncbi:alkyl sulfatase C-terminal domain-containing protein [Streptomyces sp. ODS28]|uniref:alkyl sulfatase C-terminal domain-containing protein n=1 Tax=Streptomyces sp. ODS28 TaxID=3136688 RepID=UPI0031E83507